MHNRFKRFTPNEYKDIREKCWIEFECPSCHEVLDVDSKHEPVTCSCGKKYKVSAILYHVV